MLWGSKWPVRSVRNIAFVVDEGMGMSLIHPRQHRCRMTLCCSYDETAWVLWATVHLLNELETPISVAGEGKGDLRD